MAAVYHLYSFLLIARFIVANELGFIETLVSLNRGNSTAFTMIQEYSRKPGTLIAFLSHSIVMFDVSNPRNLRHVAGTQNLPGNARGTGSRILFSDPWDLAQLPNNDWWITDSGNNCIRRLDFAKNSENRRGTSAISPVSVKCDPNRRRSDVRDTLSESSFYRPRGLAYYAPKNIVYLTYEEPYALAEIDLGSRRVVILTSNGFWPLRRIIPFHSEIIISTHPKDLLYSYRDSKLGTVINSEWRNNTPRVRDSQRSYVSGITVLPGYTMFLQTMSEQNVLVLVNQEKKLKVKICSGKRGNVDGNLNKCELDSPRFVTLINDTLYIGEQGTSGGGIRTIRITDFDTGSPQPVTDVTAVASSVPVVLLVVIAIVVVGAVFYRRKRRQTAQNPSQPATFPVQASDVRPVPRPRTYAEIRAAPTRGSEHIYAEIDENDQMKYMNSDETNTMSSSGYTNFGLDTYVDCAETVERKRSDSIYTQSYMGPDVLGGAPIPAPRTTSSLDRDIPLTVDVPPVEVDEDEEAKISEETKI